MPFFRVMLLTLFPRFIDNKLLSDQQSVTIADGILNLILDPDALVYSLLIKLSDKCIKCGSNVRVFFLCNPQEHYTHVVIQKLAGQ